MTSRADQRGETRRATLALGDLSGPLGIAEGGTGSTAATQARVALGLKSMSTQSSTDVNVTALTASGQVTAGGIGGFQANSIGGAVVQMGLNSQPGGYTAGVSGYGFLCEMVLATGLMTFFVEGNSTAGAAHSHTDVMHWDAAGSVTFPQSVSGQFASTDGSSGVTKLTITSTYFVDGYTFDIKNGIITRFST